MGIVLTYSLRLVLVLSVCAVIGSALAVAATTRNVSSKVGANVGADGKYKLLLEEGTAEGEASGASKPAEAKFEAPAAETTYSYEVEAIRAKIRAGYVLLQSEMAVLEAAVN